ncbi:hypothetical protein B0J13DRAFT_14618 [Dactylonectria estremocensis]|uniref:Uncharacterized protein n=1 Tax=Dactylonectria estremocensis TaxID=1079267 RepID=A0A9P9FIW7_9HYPO|nr:hypothetical protein B0J13DRAFT_14618 [Dactylonectria estremocensis]
MTSIIMTTTTTTTIHPGLISSALIAITPPISFPVALVLIQFLVCLLHTTNPPCFAVLLAFIPVTKFPLVLRTFPLPVSLLSSTWVDLGRPRTMPSCNLLHWNQRVTPTHSPSVPGPCTVPFHLSRALRGTSSFSSSWCLFCLFRPGIAVPCFTPIITFPTMPPTPCSCRHSL